jgi:hypothetical protein
MAQTTVELIIKDLDNECKERGMFVNWDMYLAMEKERIEMAYQADRYPCSDIDAETYYKETYNN